MDMCPGFISVVQCQTLEADLSFISVRTVLDRKACYFLTQLFSIRNASPSFLAAKFSMALYMMEREKEENVDNL